MYKMCKACKQEERADGSDYCEGCIEEYVMSEGYSSDPQFIAGFFEGDLAYEGG